MNKKLIRYYIFDFLLWIFLIFAVIFIADLSKKYEIVKHILLIITTIFILYRLTNTLLSTTLKNFLILIACFIYLYKDSYTKNLYEKYFGYIIFLNIFIMCIPAFYNKNYNLGILLLLLSLLTPIEYGKYDENKFIIFNIIYVYIIIILFIYASNFRHYTLLVLISIIPMLIKYNNNPVLYRIVGLLVYKCLYTNKYELFYSKYRYPTIFINQTSKISNNHLADLVFKNNDWRTSNIYIIFIIIGYVLVYKTFIFMKKNNIKTFIT